MDLSNKRQIKKRTLNYALETCDRQLLTNLLSNKGDIDGRECLEVLKCIKNYKTNYKDCISPLQAAVTLGYYDICKHLLQEGATLGSSAKRTPHPLCQALIKSHINIAHLLIKSGADVNLAFKDALPMYYALSSRHCTVEIVSDIIAAGFPKDGICHLVTKRTALHLAVMSDNIKVLKYLLSISVDLNVKDYVDETPLHHAFSSSIIKLLVKNGAIIDCENDQNHTPLLIAIAMRNCTTVELLLSLGADVHYMANNGEMPLHYAGFLCNLKAVEILVEKGAGVNNVSCGETALQAACRAEPEQHQINALNSIVELLIKKGADVKVLTNQLTPLQIALAANNIGAANILIMNGAELNDRIDKGANSSGLTTFHGVAKLCDINLIRLCLEYGADCLAVVSDDMYPCCISLVTATFINMASRSNTLYSQSQKDMCDVFKLFWKYRFPFDKTIPLGRSRKKSDLLFPPKLLSLLRKQKMLFIGLTSSQPLVVQKAIAQGAEVNCCSSDIPYPLHYIAEKGNYIIMREFLRRGVAVNVVNKQGETPLQVAAKAGHVSCCHLLLEYGAVYNYSSPKCAKTPLKMAKDNGHTEVVALLTNVADCFKKVKSSQGYLRYLNPEMRMFKAVMNCCCIDGMSLLGRVIHLGMKETAANLMSLRQQNSYKK